MPQPSSEPARDELLDAARRAQLSAYCPYSGYRVGAALRTTSGAVFVGCNVENAAYPEGTCAEAGAIAAMAVAGEREIAEVVTVTDGERPGSPCGGCRQKIREFSSPATVVRSFGAVGAPLVFSVAALLPESFGPSFLLDDVLPGDVTQDTERDT